MPEPASGYANTIPIGKLVQWSVNSTIPLSQQRVGIVESCRFAAAENDVFQKSVFSRASSFIA
jgi:hypothetical protein